MEIENNRVVSLATPAKGQEVPVDTQRNGHDKAASSESTGSSASSADKVSLTGEVSKLQALEHELASQPVVDRQRVDAVRSAVDNGTFEINPERIADKMMSLEQALTDAR